MPKCDPAHPTPPQRGRRRLLILLLAAATPFLADAAAAAQHFPNVTAAEVQQGNGGKFDFHVTISSPYDTPQRYADAYRVLGPGGAVYGTRILWHDHQDEQPFTRSLYGVTVPPGVSKVVIQARDQKYGYGGGTVEVALPGR